MLVLWKIFEVDYLFTLMEMDNLEKWKFMWIYVYSCLYMFMKKTAKIA